MSASALPSQPRAQGAALPWRRGPLRPRLSPGEIHVWSARLGRLGDRSDLLSEAERDRRRRIVSERDRRLWGRSRSVLRVLLARYLDAAPEQVPLVLDANGKPCLGRARGERRAAGPAASLHFNLSHSGELALYAFSSSWPVGVDVELGRVEKGGARRDHVALARRVFGEREGRRLQALPPASREHEFLRLWTRYEAALKRVGSAISATAGASVDDASGTGAIGADARGGEEPAWIVELDIGAEGAAALAGAQAASMLRLWEFA
jgi:4'-phosphopantetheinyl transferase